MNNYVRVLCKDVQVGDLIAQRRNLPAMRVTAIVRGPKANYIAMTSLQGTPVRIRPRHDTKLWKVSQ